LIKENVLFFYFRSDEGQLAILTSRGLFINDLLPDPTNQSSGLNFRSFLLPIDDNEEANPSISK
jgi:hypothetical protein